MPNKRIPLPEALINPFTGSSLGLFVLIDCGDDSFIKQTWWCLFGQIDRARRINVLMRHQLPWWRHQMETFSALLALCVGNSPVTGEFPSQRPVTRSFDIFSDLRLNQRLSKQSWGWWFETPPCALWRHSNDWGWYLKQGSCPKILQFIETIRLS